jgi:hypothetical protein
LTPMNREWSKPPVWLILAMWLALPITASQYRQNWDRLPARMAVHFDAEWNPNGFTSREGAEDFGLVITTVMLAVFTTGAFATRATKQSAAWPLLVVFYIVLGFLWYGNHSIIEFNLRAVPPRAAAQAGFSYGWHKS